MVNIDLEYSAENVERTLYPSKLYVGLWVLFLAPHCALLAWAGGFYFFALFHPAAPWLIKCLGIFMLLMTVLCFGQTFYHILILLTSTGCLCLNARGVEYIVFPGRLRLLCWKEVEQFHLEHLVKGPSYINIQLKGEDYKNRMKIKCRPLTNLKYQGLSKQELVNLLNEWRCRYSE